jgi:hypothetical protein
MLDTALDLTILYSDHWLSLYQVGLKLNWTHADDVNLLECNIGTTNKNTETLIDTSKEAGLKSKCKEN